MTFEEKVRGCWLGKCLGGGIGMAYEGVPYRPRMREEDIFLQDVPNDDLELQLVWLRALEEFGLTLGHAEMAEVWRRYIPHGLDEYSVALRNMKRGIMPPASGWKDNPFADGMGAAIRSEIWAAVFAGRPDAAMHFAEIDSTVDHWGDGVWGELFMAAAECHAFEHGDRIGALRFALEQMPQDCRTARTLKRIHALYDAGTPEAEAREIVLRETHHPNFTDCVMNLAYVNFALLWGEGEFIRSVLLAVNMGRDTDCTAASAGAFLGILGAIPPEWAAKVTDKITVSAFIAAVPGVELTISGLVRKTVEMHRSIGNPPQRYAPYQPYVPTGNLPSLDRSTWLVIPESKQNKDLVDKILQSDEKVTEDVTDYRATFDGLMLDLTPWAKEGNTLHLFSFLEVENAPEEAVLSMTADTGLTLWIDGKRLLNHHSRQAALPSFHRAEGGAAFLWPVPKKRVLVHIRLLSCLPPLRCCLMFGNLDNDHLDGFKLNI